MMRAKAEGNSASKDKGSSVVTVILVAALLLGAGLIAYPTVADLWNQSRATQAMEGYSEAVSALDDKRTQTMLDEATAYNDRLAQSYQAGFVPMSSAEEAAYNRLLAVDGVEVMAALEIPSIGVNLPVYHGTSDRVLQSGIGHLAGSSLPVGGKSSHCVLMGHRGLTSARLLTDLDQVREGDYFSVTVLGQQRWYQVDQIRIVEPQAVSELAVEPGHDYCTLVTCTPYGVNTHRLLVRGTSAEPPAEYIVPADATLVNPLIAACGIAIPILLVLVAVMLVRTRRPKPRHTARRASNQPDKAR